MTPSLARLCFLETEWVLRSAYGYRPSQVGEALRTFAGLLRVSLEDPALAATALESSVKNGRLGCIRPVEAIDHIRPPT
jgi:hypothetical protein